MLRRREANATSYVSDYLTRSVRRASGFVLADHPGVIVAAPRQRPELAAPNLMPTGTTPSNIEM